MRYGVLRKESELVVRALKSIHRQFFYIYHDQQPIQLKAMLHFLHFSIKIREILVQALATFRKSENSTLDMQMATRRARENLNWSALTSVCRSENSTLFTLNNQVTHARKVRRAAKGGFRENLIWWRNPPKGKRRHKSCHEIFQTGIITQEARSLKYHSLTIDNLVMRYRQFEPRKVLSGGSINGLVHDNNDDASLCSQQ